MQASSKSKGFVKAFPQSEQLTAGWASARCIQAKGAAAGLPMQITQPVETLATKCLHPCHCIACRPEIQQEAAGRPGAAWRETSQNTCCGGHTATHDIQGGAA